MERIGLIGDNSVEYINLLLDIWNKGNSAVLIDWRMPGVAIIEMLKEASVNECYIDESLFDKFNDVNIDNINFLKFNSNNKTAQIVPMTVYNKFSKNYSKEEAIVLYSSGTTGKAKGIMLSHFAINTNADAIIDYMKLNPQNDSLYIVKSLSHSSTLVGELLVGLKSKTKVIIAPTIVPPHFTLINISKFDATIICVNPTLLYLYNRMQKKIKLPLDKLRIIYTSGSIIDANVFHESRKIFSNAKIFNMYGLTEAGPRVTVQRGEYINNGKDISVGTQIKDVFVKIIDNDGKELNKNQIGVIHVKTPSLFSGYITGNSRDSLLHDWFNTGDIGFIDHLNELHIVGRLDNMILISSHNVYPEYIEQKIKEIPEILDCIICSQKDALLGEKMICYFISDIAYDALSIKKKLINLCPYEIPSDFIRVSNIPVSNNGKPIRNISAVSLFVL